MIWQNPWAWAGLALLALPVLVHLLSRAPAELRQFPSLRFIEATRLPPRRRTRVRDVPLLLVRLGILAAAIAALAQPLVRARHGNSAANIVRAIVVDTSASMQRTVPGGSGAVADSARRIASASADDAARSVVIATASVADALPGVAEWLGQQPGRHELVVVSDFQRGTLDSLALRALPARYGIRLVRVAGSPVDTSFAMSGAAGARALRVTPLEKSTRITSQGATTQVPASAQSITMLGSDAERAGANAAMNAALSPMYSLASDSGRATVADVRFRTTPAGLFGDSARGTRDVRIVYPGFAERQALIDRATLPAERWMGELLLELQSNALLQDAVRDARPVPATAFSANESANDSAKRTGAAPMVVLGRDAGGEPIVWAAQDSTANGGALLLFVNAEAGSLTSAALVRAAASSMADDVPLAEHEPFTTSDQELQRWSRTSTDSASAETEASARALASTSAIDGGDSDARWLWLVALVLLGVETWMRRASRNAAELASEAA